MTTRPKIEDLRRESVGDVAMLLPEPAVVAFHAHANLASDLTYQALRRLGGWSAGRTVDPRLACVEWWRTIETLVAALVIVARREHELGLRPVDFSRRPPSNSDGFRDRWTSLPSFFASSDDEAAKPPPRLTNRIDDLRRFRNSYEHSGGAETLHHNHTGLAPEPRVANVADAFEAMDICIETAGYVRHIIPACDLMPSVRVPVADPQVVFFEKLDLLARDLLFPAFHEVLALRQLRTEIQFSTDHATPCSSRSKLPVSFGIRHYDGFPTDPLACLRDRVTNYQDAHHRRPDTDTFGIPDYSTTQ